MDESEEFVFALGSFFYFSQDCFAVFVIAIVLVERFKNTPKKERGGIKKVFFLLLVKILRPPLPFFDHLSFF